MILAQANLDASIATLLSRVGDTYVHDWSGLVVYRCAQTVQIRPAHADKLNLLDQMKQTTPFPQMDRE